MKPDQKKLLLLGVLILVGGSAKKLRLTLDGVRALARSAGFPDPDLAAAVAWAESGGDARAVGDAGKSCGLWQIHTPAHPEFARVDLFDPQRNARAAFAVSKGGVDWTPWTTFRTGAYKRFLRGPA